jgi:hypothetical protein
MSLVKLDSKIYTKYQESKGGYMTIRKVNFSVPVKHSVTNARQASASSIHPQHILVSKVMKFKVSAYEEVKKGLEANKFVEQLSLGWSERFIVIDEPNHMLDKISEEALKHAQNDPLLSFEDFTSQRLNSFEEYRGEHRKNDDVEIIQRSYEGYCKGSYKSYLIVRD